MTKIQLGQKVRDTITGYTGVAVARTEWMYGCVRITVQSQELKDGLPTEGYAVDEPQLELVEDKKPQTGVTTTAHGDRPSVLRATEPTRR